MEIRRDAQCLKSLEKLPAGSLLLGIGLDGIPLILDLSDWGVGSILVAADDKAFIQRVLEMVIAAAEVNNSRYNLCLQVISSSSGSSSSLLRSETTPAQPGLGKFLDQMYLILRQREEGRLRMPYHLILIKNWRQVVELLPQRSIDRLMCLVAHGPFWGIWVMAGMVSEQLQEDYYEQVERFPSRVVGNIRDISLARYFTGLPLAKLSGLTPDQAVVRVGEDVFSVALPRIGTG
jgi:hypothetical protein